MTTPVLVLDFDTFSEMMDYLEVNQHLIAQFSYKTTVEDKLQCSIIFERKK